MLVEKKITEWNQNPYTLFANDWAALSTGNEQDGVNAMTIAWGTIGALWEKDSHSNRLPVLTVFVRPNRYTDIRMKTDDYFSVAVLEDKKILGYLGSHSGREADKYKGAGITPVFDGNTVYPKEAKLVFLCRKLYQAPLAEEGFCDEKLVDFNYPARDFHTMYVGQIEKILMEE